MKNIFRLVYRYHCYSGYRVNICRKGNIYTEYFSEAHYGSAEEALKAAQEKLLRIKVMLGLPNADARKIFDELRNERENKG